PVSLSSAAAGRGGARGDPPPSRRAADGGFQARPFAPGPVPGLLTARNSDGPRASILRPIQSQRAQIAVGELGCGTSAVARRFPRIRAKVWSALHKIEAATATTA